MSIKAMVQKVILDGKHGLFFVATSDQIPDGSVTCSLEPTVWKESMHPEEGDVVFLDELRQKRAGWRAKMGRFWKPSDEQNQQTERSKTMQFLYPTSRQFPFDEVCERIVRGLEERNFQVPGIKVTFDEYGTGEAKFRMVKTITGNDFKLWFCRVQGRLGNGRWNDIAAVTEIVIPMMELHVYEDEAGPTLYTYVGKNWKRDREKFMQTSKVNSKLREEPRMYLQYTGGRKKPDDPGYQYYHRGRRSPYLVHTNNLGREYDPEGKEPHYFVTNEIFIQFTKWLINQVLSRIETQPVPSE